VYYKRPDSKEWKGPGVVIGQDGVVVFVRHGGLCVRVHQCRLQKTTGFCDATSVGDSCVVDKQVEKSDNSADVVDSGDSSDFDVEHDAGSGAVGPVDDGSRSQAGVDSRSGCFSIMEQSVGLKPGQSVKFVDRDNGEVCVVKVIGRAGKATGGNKYWYNLEYVQPSGLAGTQGSVDLSKVDQLQKIDIEQDDESVFVLEDVSFDEAKSAELESWKRNCVFEEVLDTGQKCISTKWVCTLKDTPDGILPKARLVARGFEEMTTDLPKDSPTCSTESLRVILAIFALKHWRPKSIDIKTAFLQGSELTRDIFVKPPKEAGVTDSVWWLRKCVYGLADASLYWYNRVRQVMQECGAKVSSVDPAVFYWLDEDGNLRGVLASHVDDFIWAGSVEFEKSVIPAIRDIFLVGREESRIFSYVGMKVVADIEDEILLSQEQYVDNLKPIEIDRARYLSKDLFLTQAESDFLRSKIGQILWVARQSRPDVLFDVSSLASSLKVARVEHLIEANKVVKRLKSEKVTLKFQNLGASQLQLVVFSDASLGNLPDGGTQGGHFIVLMGQDGLFSPLCWQSKRIRRVVRSTLAGETLALADGIDNAIFLSTLYKELMLEELLPIRCVVDNHSLCDAIKSTKFVSDKRLRLEISSIKELIERKQIQHVQWSTSKEQLADCLTKKGASPYILLKAIGEGVWRV
jgi:hypothetical protein